MNQVKYEYIYINFISHYKFSLNKNKYLSKKFFKIILIFWLLKKYDSSFSFKIKKLKNNFKKFSLVKGPKAHKTGKLSLKFQYFKYLIILKKKINFKKNLKNLFNYFKYYIYMLKFFDNPYIINNKLKLITYSNIIFVKFMLFLIIILYLFYFLNISNSIFCILNIFIIYLLFFLQIVFFTTCERKILALTQRRIGPNIVGDRGRLQYIADALKLVLKVYFSPRKINNLFFQGSSIFIFYISWFNFININYSYGEDINEIEYNIFFAIICSLGFSIAWLIAGWSSISKYALLGCIRSAIQIISYEILTSSIFLILFILLGSVNFETIIDLQSDISIFFILPILIINYFLATLMETNRPPFDLSEAESDVVAGYIVEYSGIIFGLFYLGEYINIFSNSFFILILFSNYIFNIYSYFSSVFFCFSKLMFFNYYW